MDRGDDGVVKAAGVKASRRRCAPEVGARVIQVDPGSIDSVFEIRACLKRGELVAILGDRMEPGDQGRASRISLPPNDGLQPPAFASTRRSLRSIRDSA